MSRRAGVSAQLSEDGSCSRALLVIFDCGRGASASASASASAATWHASVLVHSPALSAGPSVSRLLKPEDNTQRPSRLKGNWGGFAGQARLPTDPESPQGRRAPGAGPDPGPPER